MRRLGAVLAVLALTAGCMAGYTAFQRQKVYANQSVAWLEEMHVTLTEMHAAAGEAERAWLEAEVNPRYNDLKRAVRGYILGLEIWQATGTKPATLDGQQRLVQELTVLVFELIATAAAGGD